VTDTRKAGLVDRLCAAKRRHEARRKPSGFEFAFADRIAYVNPAHWDALTAGASIFASRAYLSALDDAAPDNVSPRYAVAYRDGAPAVAVSMQLARIRGEDVLPRRAGAAGAPRVPWRRAIRPRVLVCGNLLAWGRHGVCRAAGVSAAEAWPAVAEALYRVRSAERLSGNADFVLVKDLGDDDVAGVEALETYSYRPFETDPDMVLDLPASCATLDDYFGLFRGKYRKTAKSVIASTERAGYRVEPVDDLARHAARIHELYREVHANASVRPFTLSPHYLPRVATALADGFRCVTIEKDGAIAGFVTVVNDGATAVAYYIGYDRAANETAPLYFRLLYAAVETSLAMGCRRISFGRTALEPKARLGARPVPLKCWVRHRVPVVNVALRRLLREVPHDVAPDRSPFHAE
jgi:hypothetical protein